MRSNLDNKKRVLFLVKFSMLLAIEAIVCFTPLGSLPIGPIVATLALIPVIITAILLGTKAGAAMGFFAGLFSFMVWTFMPPVGLPVGFVFSPFYPLGENSGNFWSLVICFVPRILVGVVSGASFKIFLNLFSKYKKFDVVAYAISAVLGSMTNTILVLFGIYFFFGQEYASVFGMAYNLLLGAIGTVIVTNGIPEAVIGAIAAVAICKPLRVYMKSNQ
ncbi:MAG: rane protein [Clostridiales bacterium]|jgi:uncharacterized membrane protein|nr:rane protein [Clostridiales bacterium]